MNGEVKKITSSLQQLQIVDPETKKLYNTLVIDAKSLEKQSRFKESLILYQKAYQLIPHTELPKKIKYLESKITLQTEKENPPSVGKKLIVKKKDSETPKEQPSQDKKRDDCSPFTYDSKTDLYHLKVKNLDFKIQGEILSSLYPYQREGVKWLAGLHLSKGGILGDDMGLGKTVQISSFISGLVLSKLATHFIIGMPVSVIQNWSKELSKWAPDVEVYIYHNVSNKQRTEMLNTFKKYGGVLLTTYGMITSQIENFEKYCKNVDYIFLDEGHKIKNPKIKLSQNLRKFTSKHRVVLSGTPIQNDLMEMWALFDYIFDGELLGPSRSFSIDYAKKIERATQKDATNYEKKLGIEIGNKFQQIINPYFLRREKGKVLTGKKISKKNDFIIWTHLSESQLKIYQDFIQSNSVKDVLNKTSCALSALTVLKQICDHPLLLEKEEFKDNFSKIKNVEEILHDSGKLLFTNQILKELKDTDHRVLIFSQSTKMLDIIELLLAENNMKCLRIDGSITDSKKRQDLIDKFNKDSSYFCFLLTTQVGGIGITLTGADRVIIFDPSWNPATDNQAVDRAYRIGQTKNVIVYRLITCSTIEEKIYRKQIFKDALSKSATEKTNQYRYFTREELKDLFKLDDPKVSQTQIQLSKIHQGQRQSYEELELHIKKLNQLGIFGISDHDLLFKNEAEDVFDDEILDDVKKSMESLSQPKPTSQSMSRPVLSSTVQKKAIAPKPQQQQIKNLLSNDELTNLFKGVRLFGESSFGKILETFKFNNRNAFILKTEWEKIKSTMKKEDLEKFLTSFDQELSKFKKLGPVPNISRATVSLDPIVDLTGLKKDDDSIFYENLEKKTIEKPVEKVVEKPKEKAIVISDDEDEVVNVDDEEETESEDEPENEIIEMIKNDKLKDEGTDKVAKRLSLCFGLTKVPKRRLITSDDEEEKDEYMEKLKLGGEYEGKKDIVNALKFYMEAFEISQKDKKLEFKIYQIGKELNF